MGKYALVNKKSNTIVLLELEYSSPFSTFYQSTLASLGSGADIKKVTESWPAIELLLEDSPPRAVIVSEIEVFGELFRNLAKALVHYTRSGGTTVFACSCILYIQQRYVEYFFHRRMEIPWRVGSARWTKLIANTNSPLHTSIPERADMAGICLWNVAIEDMVYLADDDSKEAGREHTEKDTRENTVKDAKENTEKDVKTNTKQKPGKNTGMNADKNTENPPEKNPDKNTKKDVKKNTKGKPGKNTEKDADKNPKTPPEKNSAKNLDPNSDPPRPAISFGKSGTMGPPRPKARNETPVIFRQHHKGKIGWIGGFLHERDMTAILRAMCALE